MTVKYDAATKTYFIDLSLGTDPVTGKRRRTTRRGFKTKKEATATEAKIKHEHNIGKSTYKPGKFSEYLSDFMGWYKGRVRQSTYEKREFMIEKHVLPTFGNVQLENITPASIQRWQSAMLKRDLSRGYVQNAYAALNQILRRAVKDGTIARNPAELIGGLTVPTPEYEFWTTDQYRQYEAVAARQLAARKRLMYTAAVTLFWSGLRSGELRALSPDDIQDGYINVTKTLVYNNRKDYRTEGPKTKRSIRRIRIDETTSEILERWKKIHATLPIDHTYLFSVTGYPLSDNTIPTYLRRFPLPDSVPVIRAHDLRHSHASFLIHAGIDIVSVSRRLGHATTNETLRTYGHLYPDADAAIIEAIEESNRSHGTKNGLKIA